MRDQVLISSHSIGQPGRMCEVDEHHGTWDAGIGLQSIDPLLCDLYVTNLQHSRDANS